MNNPRDPVAIIGIGCRFPGGANSHKAFWRLLTQGKDAITDVPPDRWDSRRFYDADPDKPGKVYVKQAGFLKEKIYDFDSLFFGISPREAESMDPQQRLLLEVTWEAFEDAGLIIDDLSGSQTGVFIGGFTLDNLLIRLNQSNRELTNSHTGASCTMTMLSNRISHIFNLHGPSITIDTACSSSLVATHYACQSLWAKECETAIVGGVNVILGPEYSLALSKGRFLSDHGRCMAFDERAAGYTRGEGAGIAILKPLSSALRDNDRIYALLCMSGVNQDGHTPGISMPNAEAQEALIREVYERANVSGQDIGYVEAHGTGTQAGDPKELRALNRVISENRTNDSTCLVGSVKTNIGHLEAGAGIAGLIKATLCLQHKKIPPNLHFEKPNPAIPFDEMNLRVPTEVEEWPIYNGTRYAGINSFGYGGTNAHVLLREAPERNTPDPVEAWDKPWLLPLSARSESALRALAGKYAFFLSSQSGPRLLTDFLYTVTQRRSHHSHRLTLIAQNQEDMREKLQLFSAGDYIEHQSMGVAQTDEAAQLVFIYTGMGPQWWAMGRELMAKEALFLDTIKECDEVFQQEAGWSIYEALMQDENSSQMERTEIAQPANFVIQAGLTAHWEARGIKPDAVIGHSVGEVTAAYVSGALSLEDAITVSVHRSRLQATTAGKGGMMAIGLPETDALELIKDHDQIAIGAINSPAGVTLSGDNEQLDEIAAILQSREIFNRRLDVEVAYHSPQMESIEDELLTALSNITPRASRYPLYSTVTANLIEGDTLGADYWWNNVRESVRFADGIKNLIEQGHSNFLEIGPHPVLAHSVKEVAAGVNTKVNLVSSLNRKFPEQPRMLESLGELYTLGLPVNWNSVIPGGGRFISIPTYPWQKEHYWTESEESRECRFGREGSVFLNNKLPLPRPAWTVELNHQFFPFLDDHKVNNEIVFPGMAYVDAGLAVHKNCLGQEHCVLSDIELHNMLFIEPQRVQILSVDYDEPTKRLSISSRYKEDNAVWKPHASGKLIEGHYTGKQEPVDIKSLRGRISEEVDTGQNYADLKERGLAYGPAFQCANKLWTSNDEILLHIQKSPVDMSRQESHLLYPPMTDTALQSILAIVPGDTPFVPTAIDKVILYRALEDECWCHGIITRRDRHTFIASYYFYDTDGNVMAEFHDVSHQEVPSAAKHEDDFLGSSLYQLNWVEHRTDIKETPEIKECLIFACESEVNSEISAALEQRNSAYTTILKGENFEQAESGKFIINADDKADFERLFECLKDKPITHIFYLWSLAQDTSPDFDSMVSTCTQLTYLVQAINTFLQQDIELVLLMQGSQLVLERDAEPNLNLSALWGLGQLIQNEHPNIHCRMLDIERNIPITRTDNWFSRFAFDESNELAFRSEGVFTRQLEPRSPDKEKSTTSKIRISTDEPVSLEILQPGNLESLTYVMTERRPPEEGEVEIKVHYSALNFKDVLKAYGTISSKVTDDTYFGSDFGMEVTGTIVKTGSNVSGLKTGDEVASTAIRAFSSYVTVPAEYVLKKPHNLKLEEFCIHVAYLTAYYGLINLASLKSKERVLIHSASGGLGLAAVQIAQWIGAEIYATAGTVEKRNYLRSLGIQHVFDSRTLDFTDEIHRLTQGNGIDVVLNSLSGETLIQSFKLLAPYGRFIEVGKQDITENSGLPMSVFNKNITFSSVDLDRMYLERPEIIISLLSEIEKGFQKGYFYPHPTTTYTADKVDEALRYMGQGKHIGKIVVKYANETITTITEKFQYFNYDKEDAYIITGGTSGFGLEVARWLGNHGAHRLYLLSRRGAVTEGAQSTINYLRENNVEVECPTVNISNHEEVKQLVASIQAQGNKIKGIIHSAMVLDDGFIMDMDETRYRNVMSPKIAGALNLHDCVNSKELDFFVLFSSIASLVGNRGQANYIAANSFLDDYSHVLRKQGYPAITINWGVLAETGVAARNTDVSNLLAQEGVSGLTNQQALSALDFVLNHDIPQVGVLKVDWQRWRNANKQRERLSRFKSLFASASRNQTTANLKALKITEELLSLSEEERIQHIESVLQQSVAKILKLTPNKVALTQDIGKLGIDSLMFLELTLTIQDSFGLDISTMELMKEPVISILAKTILNKLFAVYESAESGTNLLN